MGYLEFVGSVRFNMNWTMLKYKNEYGITSSEQSLYQHLVDEVSGLAMKLSLDYHLCEELAYAHAFSFMNGGRLGWQVVNEFLAEKKIFLDTEAIWRSNLKEKIKRAKWQPEEGFYPRLDEMLEGRQDTPEVALVIHLHRILKALQPLKNGRIEEYYALTERAIDTIREGYLKKGVIPDINPLDYCPTDMPTLPMRMSEEDRDMLYSDLDEQFSDYKSNHPSATREECAERAIRYMLDTF